MKNESKINHLTPADFESVAKELEAIKAKNYNIGDVSDTMKKVVIAVYGDEDWSCSGYWTRATEIVKEFNKAKIETIFNSHSGKGIFQ